MIGLRVVLKGAVPDFAWFSTSLELTGASAICQFERSREPREVENHEHLFIYT